MGIADSVILVVLPALKLVLWFPEECRWVGGGGMLALHGPGLGQTVLEVTTLSIDAGLHTGTEVLYRPELRLVPTKLPK